MNKEEISALYWKTIGDIKLLDGLLEGSFRDQDYDRLIEIVNGITNLLQDLRGDRSQMTNAERISTLEEIYSYFTGCYMNAPYGQARTKFQRFLDVVKDAKRRVGTERKSGRWIPYNPDSSGRSYQFDCSICKYTVRLGEPSKTWGYLFCPYCGSIMNQKAVDDDVCEYWKE